MKIISFNFDKISAEKKKSLKEKTDINVNIDLKSVEEEKIDIVKDQNLLKFNFEFKVSYKPDIADLVFSGFVLAILEKEQHKETLKKWKTKKISENIRIPLFNTILTRCNLKALQLEEELNLPAHIPFPRIQQQTQTSYTG